MSEPRIIKKYPNRRLYDTEVSRYVTLEDVRSLVLQETPFQVRDARTNEDLTRSILLQIIMEQEADGEPMFSEQVLVKIIRSYGDSLQGMMASYLERSLNLFVEQQASVQDQMKTMMGSDPLSMMREITERNLSIWQEMQEGMLRAATTRRPAGPAPLASGKRPGASGNEDCGASRSHHSPAHPVYPRDRTYRRRIGLSWHPLRLTVRDARLARILHPPVLGRASQVFCEPAVLGARSAKCRAAGQYIVTRTLLRRNTANAGTGVRGAGGGNAGRLHAVVRADTPAELPAHRGRLRERWEEGCGCRRRVALVTGGIGELGRSICERLTRQGCRVAALDIALTTNGDDGRSWQARLAGEGLDVLLVAGDVTDFDSCTHAVARAESRLGPVDILVNCAGITRDASLRKLDKPGWDAVLATNLDSVFNVTKHVIDGMTQRGFGRDRQHLLPQRRQGPVRPDQLLRRQGRDARIHDGAGARGRPQGGDREHRVAGVHEHPRMVEAVPQEILGRIVEEIPVGRLGDTREIAALVAFLCSDEAAFITGANYSINGGHHMH